MTSSELTKYVIIKSALSHQNFEYETYVASTYTSVYPNSQPVPIEYVFVISDRETFILYMKVQMTFFLLFSIPTQHLSVTIF